MKQLFLLVSIFIAFNLSSQCVSIEFSIRWRDKLFFEVEGIDTSTFKPAFLNIVYRNYCDYPVYFSRLGDENQYFLNTGQPSLGTYRPQLHYSLSSDEKYIVKPISPSYMYSVWFLFLDSIPTKSYSLDIINYLIFETHEYLYEKFRLPRKMFLTRSGQEQIFHEFEDITEDTIKGNSCSRFIFLEPKESHTESYNLIGFQLLGGTFTFQLSNDEMSDTVYSFPPIGDNSEFMRRDKKLPEQVGIYKLYRGSFLKNEVTVHFPGVEFRKEPEEKLERD